MVKPIRVYAIAGQACGTTAVSTLIRRSDLCIEWNLVTQATDVPEDGILIIDCPEAMENDFSWLNGSFCVDAIKILNSGIIPEGTKTPSVILMRNRRKKGQWINLPSNVLSIIRMYLRYVHDNNRSRLPWGEVKPKCESTKVWLTWFWSISHEWDMSPLVEYKNLRREKKQRREVRVSVSDTLPIDLIKEVF